MNQNKKFTKVGAREFLLAKLSSDGRYAERALLLLYGYQTSTEKQVNESNCKNHVGFTQWDAQILSRLAKFFLRTGFLTAGQQRIIFNRIPKYWRQILGACNLNKLKSSMGIMA